MSRESIAVPDRIQRFVFLVLLTVENNIFKSAVVELSNRIGSGIDHGEHLFGIRYTQIEMNNKYSVEILWIMR